MIRRCFGRAGQQQQFVMLVDVRAKKIAAVQQSLSTKLSLRDSLSTVLHLDQNKTGVGVLPTVKEIVE